MSVETKYIDKRGPGKVLCVTPLACPQVEVKNALDPKRYPTGPASPICTWIGPAPDCKKYVLAERTFNCEPFTQVVWFEDGNEIPQSGVPPMAELTLPEMQNDLTRLEGEVEIIVLPTDTAGTMADVIAAAVAAGATISTRDGSKSRAATAADVCAVDITKFPCNYSYLTDPADTASAVTVGVDDALYINGKPIGAKEDGAFAGVNPAAVIARGADAVFCACVQFKDEVTKAELAAL